MKKIIDFIEDNGAIIVGTVAVLFICAAIFIPLFVAIGRYLWDIAINNPAELFY